MRVFIGIDNGVSGSIGIITSEGKYEFYKTPTKIEQNYTKAKGNITRIDGNRLYEIFKPYIENDVHLYLERPLVNPGHFFATLSAMRSMEATLIVIEMCKFSYEYLDSKKWQSVLLPEGCEGNELKVASLQIGKRLFPNINFEELKVKDADGILIAEYLRRTYEK